MKRAEAKAEALLSEQKSEAANRKTIVANPYSNSPMMLNFASMPELQAPFPTTIPFHPPIPPSTPHPGTTFQTNSNFRNLDQSYSDAENTNEFLPSLQHSPNSMRNHIQPQHIIPTITPRNNSLPSLNELRNMNSQNVGFDLVGNSNPSRWENDDLKCVTTSLWEFLSSIFTIQADINGISSAVAEYLSWVRDTPGRAENSDVLEGM